MRYIDSVRMFIDTKQENNVQAQGYEKDLMVFWGFLGKRKVSDDTWSQYLGGIDTEDIIAALKYYITNNKVKSISTAKRYISVLVEYFHFVNDKKIVQNKRLYEEINSPIYSDRSFRARVNTWISENLKNKGEFTVFNEDELIDLIRQCDITLDMQEISDEQFDKKYVPALVLKLMILTGTKYKLIPSIKTASLNLRYGSIEINDYIIHMPHNLIDQFDRYIRLKNERVYSDLLFMKSNGENLSEQTSYTAQFLASVTTRTDTTGIIKYVVIQMIKKGINESIIREFTGIGQKIYDDCLILAHNDILPVKNTLLDSRIREINTFNFL